MRRRGAPGWERWVPRGAGRTAARPPLRERWTGRMRFGAASGGLDGRDLELERDLLAHQHAAGLQRGVPGDAPVLAVDGDAALEADPVVAERVLGGALELQRDGHGLRDVLDGQVAGDLEVGAAVVLDGGRDEPDLGVVLDVEEVVGAQVPVALSVAGVDAVDLQGDGDGGVGRVLAVDRRGPLDLVERAADLGDHGVAGDEADPGVRRVEGVLAGQLAGIDGGGSHGGLLWTDRWLSYQSPL